MRGRGEAWTILPLGTDRNLALTPPLHSLPSLSSSIPLSTFYLSLLSPSSTPSAFPPPAAVAAPPPTRRRSSLKLGRSDTPSSEEIRRSLTASLPAGPDGGGDDKVQWAEGTVVGGGLKVSPSPSPSLKAAPPKGAAQPRQSKAEREAAFFQKVSAEKAQRLQSEAANVARMTPEEVRLRDSSQWEGTIYVRHKGVNPNYRSGPSTRRSWRRQRSTRRGRRNTCSGSP